MRILMLMLLAGLAGCGDVKTDWACGTEDPPPPEVTVLRVEQCWIEEERGKGVQWLGTGFPISSNGIISFRHELPLNATQVSVEGQVAAIVDRGNRRTNWDDWIHVRFPSAPNHIPSLDPTLDLRSGERVAIVGFPSPPATLEHRLAEFSRTPPKTALGKIASKPFWLGLPDHVVLIKAGDTPLSGLSGGPAMVLRDNDWVVFGVYVGIVHRDILNGVFSSRLHVVRRIPEHLLEK